eukprot:scaffold29512_cov76-Skeletonema_dohrnii-CCMP3373.AAC.2
MCQLGLRCLVQGENVSWTLTNETLRPGAQLQCPSETHSLRATIEGSQRTTNPRHVGHCAAFAIAFKCQVCVLDEDEERRDTSRFQYSCSRDNTFERP